MNNVISPAQKQQVMDDEEEKETKRDKKNMQQIGCDLSSRYDRYYIYGGAGSNSLKDFYEEDV